MFIVIKNYWNEDARAITSKDYIGPFDTEQEAKKYIQTSEKHWAITYDMLKLKNPLT